MRKRFNITGSCNPEKHYMVDTEQRFRAVEKMIDYGDYFTINRARQYGKTTMLNMIWRRLHDKYVIIDTSFEGVGDSSFENEKSFVRLFVSLMKEALQLNKADDSMVAMLNESSPENLDELSGVITRLCQSSPKPVLLLCYAESNRHAP